MLSGPLHNVLTALYLILEKVANDNTHRLQNDNNTEQVGVQAVLLHHTPPSVEKCC